MVDWICEVKTGVRKVERSDVLEINEYAMRESVIEGGRRSISLVRVSEERGSEYFNASVESLWMAL